jgi:hypothetical protein
MLAWAGWTYYDRSPTLHWFKSTTILLLSWKARAVMVDLLQKPEIGWEEDIRITLEEWKWHN